MSIIKRKKVQVLFQSLEFFPEVAAKGRKHFSWLVVTKEKLESIIREEKKPYYELFSPSILR